MRTQIAPILAPDEHTLGPAMKQLTEKQQKFVIALVETGGGQTECAALAGYSPNGRLQAVMGHHNMRNEKVLAAVREEADKRLRASALLASSVMIQIAADNTHKDQLKAAVELANRGGLSFVQRHEVIHKDERSAHELALYIKSLAVQNGMDPRKLLGYDPASLEEPEVEDAEFEEINVQDEFEAMLG